MVVGQLPPYNWRETQGPILILALNTDRSRGWSRGWMEDRSISRFVAAFLVRSTFQPTKNQTFSFITLRHVRTIYIYIFSRDFVPRVRSFVILFCNWADGKVARKRLEQCWSIPFGRCCIYTRFNACSCEISIGVLMYILLVCKCWDYTLSKRLEKRNRRKLLIFQIRIERMKSESPSLQENTSFFSFYVLATLTNFIVQLS